MKKFLVVLLILIPSFTFSQLKQFPKNEKGEVEYSEIIECNLPVNVMYSNAKEWIALTFGDYKSVIQFEDDINHKLILKAFTKISNVFKTLKAVSTNTPAPKETVHYAIMLEFKEGKYRYRINEITINTDEFVFGSWQTTKSSPTDLYDQIIKIQNETKELNAKDKSLLKKKEIKSLEESISNLDTQYSTLAFSYALCYGHFPKLIQTLKEALSKNNSF